jgi:hypothetical protein
MAALLTKWRLQVRAAVDLFLHATLLHVLGQVLNLDLQFRLQSVWNGTA